MIFTKELSIYLKSTVPLHEALVTLSDHEHLTAFRKIVSAVAMDIDNGQTLARSLARFPKIFDRLYISLVEVGEISGTLPMTLEHLAGFLERSYALRKKVQSIFLYPSIVITVALSLGTFITVYILPQLVRLFSSFQTALPLSTKLLLGFSSFIERYGWWVLGGVFCLIILLKFLWLVPQVVFGWQRMSLRLPFFGGFLRQYALAAFFHDVGIMLKSGMPIAQALAVEKRSHQNDAFRRVSADLERSLHEGRALWQVIEEQHQRLFPPIVVKMLSVGERSGKLEETFFYLADFFDEEVERSIKNFTVLLEPILLIVIGSMVAFIATAILAPIYSLTGSIRR